MTREEILFLSELSDTLTTLLKELDILRLHNCLGLAERCGMETVVCYDYDKLIQALMKTFTPEEPTPEEALEGITVDDKLYMTSVEWYDTNVNGGYIGELTPIVVRTNIE